MKAVWRRHMPQRPFPPYPAHLYHEIRHQPERETAMLKTLDRKEVQRVIDSYEKSLSEYKELLSKLPEPARIGDLIEDPYGSGAVLRIHKKFGKTARAGRYTYAAVKGGDEKWYLSGSTTPFGDHDPLTWQELADFCVGASVVLLTYERFLQHGDG